MKSPLWRLSVVLGAVLACSGLVGTARSEPFHHVTDGQFTNPLEWGTVIPSFFQQTSDGTGGAYLYVEQGFAGVSAAAGVLKPDTLFLMYDFVDSNTSLTPTQGHDASNSFFDVFFQVPVDNTDYLIRILNTGNANGSFLAFEKPESIPSNINPDGTFDTGSPWTPVADDDLALGKFQAAIGFGTSPNSGTPHLMAEFQVSINRATSSGGGPTGLYDPSPAFWSASADPKTGPDPPISSGIFTLNPDGTTTVVPVLGPDGGPIKQPQPFASTVPEPASVVSLGLGLGVLALARWRRGRAAR